MDKFFHSVFILTLSLNLFLISGCTSPKPNVYPNEHFNQVGKVQADKDIETAVKEADEKNLNSKWKSHTLKTGLASVAGGGVGAAVGAISGGLIVGSISGAIVGFAGGLTNWIIDSYQPTEEYKYYVKKRLEEKGYKVIGW